MNAIYCCHATGQKEKSSAKYSKCTQIDVGSLISTLLFLIGTIITKDATHKERSNKMSQIVEISDENTWPLDEADFLTNYTNKQSFVDLLVYKLELHGFKTVLCPSDADIRIKKTSLQVQNHFTVTILADATDIFCLLLYYMYYSNNKNETCVKNM